MTTLAAALLTNAGVAIALAATVELLRHRLRRPELLHLLWLVALLRLVAPPLVELPVLPGTLAAGSAGPPAAAELPLPAAPLPATPPDAPWMQPAIALTLLWLAFGSGILLVAAHRWRALGRLLDASDPPPPALTARLGALARQVGLARAPGLHVVRSAIAPAVLLRSRGAEILIPRELTQRLGGEELDALLLHELAHVRRRDHWVRILELAVTALCWWNPATWWVRRRLHEAEEQCCDRTVVRLLGGPDAYAQALVETLALTRRQPARVPVVATTAVGRQDLEERLTMLFDATPIRPSTTVVRSGLAIAAVAALAFFPMRARTAELEATTRPSSEIESELLALERQALALEEQHRELEQRRFELERQLHQGAMEQEAAELAQQTEELLAQGDEAEAKVLQLELERLEQRRALDAERFALRASMNRELAPRQRDARRLQLEAEELRRKGEEQRAEELAARAEDMQREVVSLAAEMEHRHLELERQHRQRALAELERSLAARRDALEVRAEQARREQAEELARLEAEIAELERQSRNE